MIIRKSKRSKEDEAVPARPRGRPPSKTPRKGIPKTKRITADVVIKCEEYGRLQFTREAAEQALGFRISKYPASNEAFRRGQMAAEAEVRASLLEAAKGGNNPAQKAYLQLARDVEPPEPIQNESDEPFISGSDIVRLLRTSMGTLARYAKAGCPYKLVGKQRQYQYGAVSAWMEAHGLTGNTGQPCKSPQELRAALAQAELDRRTETARKLAFENAVASAKFIDREEVKRQQVERCAVLKSALLVLPGKYAAQWAAIIDPLELHEAIEAVMTEILQEFSRE